MMLRDRIRNSNDYVSSTQRSAFLSSARSELETAINSLSSDILPTYLQENPDQQDIVEKAQENLGKTSTANNIPVALGKTEGLGNAENFQDKLFEDLLDTSDHQWDNFFSAAKNAESNSSNFNSIVWSSGQSTLNASTGITTALPKEEIKKGNIVNKNGLALLKMLKIDPGAFCDSYNHPTGWSGWSEQVDLNNASHKAKLQKFLESGIGHGYTVIHQLKPGNVKVFNVTEKYMKSAATPESMTVYYGGKTGTGKRVDVVIETPKYTLGLNIRDTQGKDGYPGRIMCNFWYK
jgi:hypothetical protein